MKKIIYFITFMFFLCIVSGCSCEHEWTEANCTEPKTCTKCNEHEGEANGHAWIEATCTDPKTCETCGEIEGEALGHEEGSMKYSNTDYVDAVKIYETKCERCDKVLNSKEEKIETFIKNGKFDITPSQLSERMDRKLNSIADNNLKAKSSENNDGDFGLGIGDKTTNEVVGIYLLNNGESIVSYNNRNKNGFSGALGMIYDDEVAGRILISTVLTFDPSLSFEEAKSVAYSITDEGSYSKNGIQYLVTTSNGNYVFAVGIKK